jgi:hypothetical protein
LAELGLVRIYRRDTAGGQAVENTELLFAQAFVDHDRFVAGRTALFTEKV